MPFLFLVHSISSVFLSVCVQSYLCVCGFLCVFMIVCVTLLMCLCVFALMYGACVRVRAHVQKAEDEARARELARQRQLEAERQEQAELMQRQREQEQLLAFEEMLRRKELERERQRIVQEFTPPTAPTAPSPVLVEDVQGPTPALSVSPTPPQSPGNTLINTPTPMFDRSLKPAGSVSSGNSKSPLSTLTPHTMLFLSEISALSKCEYSVPYLSQ